MDDNQDREVSIPLGLREPLYKAITEAAHRKGVTIEQFCRDVCVPAFQRYDAQYSIENVGNGRVISTSFDDTGDDIWVHLVLSPELHQKLSARGDIQRRSAEFIAQRVCISALQAETGETNSLVARGPS
jgi:hypothetical protein